MGPGFRDGKAKRALLKNRPFATVAMVERQFMPSNAANRTFFVVYEHIGEKATRSTRDWRSRRRSTKGVQHVDPRQLPPVPRDQLHLYGPRGRHRVRNAMFLPFDLDAFQFFSRKPSNALSRGEAAVGVPRAQPDGPDVLVTFNSPEARELIAGWYRGDLFGGTFDGRFVQSGWRAERTRASFTGSLRRRLPHLPRQLCTFSKPDPRAVLAFPSFGEFTATFATGSCAARRTDAGGGADVEGVVAVGRPAAILRAGSRAVWRLRSHPTGSPGLTAELGSAYSCRAPSSRLQYVISRMADLQSKPDSDTPGPGS